MRNQFLDRAGRRGSGYFADSPEGSGSISVRMIGPKKSVQELCEWLVSAVPGSLVTGGKDEPDTGNFRQYVAVPVAAISKGSEAGAGGETDTED
jgi:hypothetical protein